MTNAIEQTKREMYDDLAILKGRIEINYSIKDMLRGMDEFEHALEAHLEELRKQTSSAMGVGGGGGQRFVYGDYDSIKAAQKIVIDGEDARRRLVEMTQDRDDCQKRMQALDHAHFNLDQANKVAGEELRKAKEQSRTDRQDLMEAERLSESLEERLRDAQAVIGKQEQLINGQRLAIADLYMVKNQRKVESGVSDRDSKENVASEQPDAKALMIVLGAIVECQQIVSDWAVYGHKAKEQMQKLANVLNGDPELQRAMRSFEKGGCMHSFHPAFPGGEQCIFCGEKR